MKPATAATPLSAKAPFLVLDASAGSGKTYNLVQHILMNALRPSGMSNGYQKVLAITFTNNAADEMKARLLKQLLEFSNEEDASTNVFFRPMEALDLDPQELQKERLSLRDTCFTTIQRSMWERSISSLTDWFAPLPKTLTLKTTLRYDLT